MDEVERGEKTSAGKIVQAERTEKLSHPNSDFKDLVVLKVQSDKSECQRNVSLEWEGGLSNQMGP